MLGDEEHQREGDVSGFNRHGPTSCSEILCIVSANRRMHKDIGWPPLGHRRMSDSYPSRTPQFFVFSQKSSGVVSDSYRLKLYDSLPKRLTVVAWVLLPIRAGALRRVFSHYGNVNRSVIWTTRETTTFDASPLGHRANPWRSQCLLSVMTLLPVGPNWSVTFHISTGASKIISAYHCQPTNSQVWLRYPKCMHNNIIQ